MGLYFNLYYLCSQKTKMLRISILHILSLLLLILFASCNSKQVTQKEVNLYSGSDTIEINSNYVVFDVSRTFSIELDSVLNDSRCPKGTNCVWEGNAKIQLKATMFSDNKTHYIQLNTYRQFTQDTIINNYRFKLLNLTPYPEQGKVFPYYDYCANIVVEKL